MEYDLKFRKENDKFYTKKDIIENIISIIFEKEYNEFTFVEPSAGDGALIDVLKKFNIDNIVAYDLYPERKDITKKNFLKLDIRTLLKKKIITFQNPPFGKSCSLAIKFFNKAALFSQEIWQIVPKTFKKDSVKNKLDLFFHLEYEIDLPKNSFLLGGEEYDVPCCFQIWKKQNSARKKDESLVVCDLFEFVEKENATHAVRRVGGKAGKLLDGIEYNKNSTYFLKIKNDKVIEILKSANLSETVSSTVGVKSLSKRELIKYIESKI